MFGVSAGIAVPRYATNCSDNGIIYVAAANWPASYGVKKHTISIWVKPGSPTGNAEIFYIGRRDTASPDTGVTAFRMFSQISGSNANFAVQGWNSSGTQILAGQSAQTYDKDTYHHVHFQLDTDNATEASRMFLTIDGTADLTGSTPTYPTLSSSLGVPDGANGGYAALGGARQSGAVATSFANGLLFYEFAFFSDKLVAASEFRTTGNKPKYIDNIAVVGTASASSHVRPQSGSTWYDLRKSINWTTSGTVALSTTIP